MTPTINRADEKTSAFTTRHPARASAQTPSHNGSMHADVRQSAGNFAVQRLLRKGSIQAKLAVSAPGDAHEQEADRAADTVMRMPSANSGYPLASVGQTQPGLLQRKCACDETPGAAGGCDSCRDKQLSLQRRAANGDGDGGAASPKVHEALRSGGQPLDGASRSFFEPRFGHDLSRVRVHSDAKASASAKTVNALAYTVGSDIVFGAGQYDSGSQAGRQLLAHELAHVIQQDFGSGLGAGFSAPLIQREPSTGSEGAGGADGGSGGAGGADSASGSTEPASSTDPNAPILPPPEHVERLERLEALAQVIERENLIREDLQTQFRSLPNDVPTQETVDQRNNLKAELTNLEYNIVSQLHARIMHIDDAIQGLEAVLPGSSPAAPKEQTSSNDEPTAANEYTVRSEIIRLVKERTENEAQMVLLKRCLARKRITELNMKIDDKDTLPEVREGLEREKAYNVEFLKSSVANINCAKPSSQTNHPTEVSAGELAKIKAGEAYISYPYIALEGEKKKSGGCTIGYGHVITARDGGRVCTHTSEEPPKKAEPAADEPKKQGNGITLKRCDCTPDWTLSEKGAEELLKSDIGVHTRRIKAQVLVDLDQGQFDALVDLSLHVGSLPKSILDVVNSKLCVDDEAVRQEYLKTSLFIKDNKERGPVFAKRRKERVWASKGDDDPTCI